MAQYLDLEGTKILANKIKENKNNKLDKTGGTVTGKTLFNQGISVKNISGGGGTTGYFHIAQIKVNGTYLNQPITFDIRQREKYGTIIVKFSNANSNDPTLQYINKIGNITAHIHKVATSTWNLYILKSESYDNLDIVGFSKGEYMSNLIVTWQNTTVTSLPSGYVTATNASIDMNTTTASKLQTARGITIGNTKKTFDGSGDISWNLSEIGASASSHTHDDRYYTETEINNKLNGKANSSHTHTKSQITDMPTSLKNPTALTVQFNGTTNKTYDGSSAQTVNITPSAIGAAASSHGTHVPTPQTANNKKFLRNDNTWQDVTPANIGAAASSHTHDDRYFTETEINNKLSPITTSLNQLSNPNLLINGDFSVWQRGENFVANSNRYTADRWHIWYTTNHVISKLENGGIRIKINSSNYNYCEIIQAIDKVDIVALRGKKVTISCKVGESSSDFTKYYINVFFSTGVNLLANDGRISNANKSVTSKGIIEHTFEVPVNANCMSIRVGVSQADTVENGGKDALAGKTLDINWVKLEVGAVATPFVPRPYGEELALCQRYYEHSVFVIRGVIGDVGSNRLSTNVQFKVTKRIIPTIKIYAGYQSELVEGTVRKSSNTTAHRGTIYAKGEDGFGAIDVVANNGTTISIGDVFEIDIWNADAEIY